MYDGNERAQKGQKVMVVHYKHWKVPVLVFLPWGW
jgi:hypothetical protein